MSFGWFNDRHHQVQGVLTAIPIDRKKMAGIIAGAWGETRFAPPEERYIQRLFAEGDEGWLLTDFEPTPTTGLFTHDLFYLLDGWATVAHFFAQMHGHEAKRITWAVNAYFLVFVAALAGMIIRDWGHFDTQLRNFELVGLAAMSFLLHGLLTSRLVSFRRSEDAKVQWLTQWRTSLPLGSGASRHIDGVVAAIKSVDTHLYFAVDTYRGWIILWLLTGISSVACLLSWRQASQTEMLGLPTFTAPW